MLKTWRSEIKEIKWLKTKDVVKQTLFSFGVITIAMAIFMAFDTGVQMLISLIV